MGTKKMQLEVERTLKKVQEGLDEFGRTWEKMDQATDAAKKDKFENELKKELKRLQRYRDQIRTWLSTQDTKALSDQLESARKQIEQEMERFKQCEKASKIKAFSKEGLVQQPKLDPEEQGKVEAANFLNKLRGFHFGPTIARLKVEELQQALRYYKVWTAILTFNWRHFDIVVAFGCSHSGRSNKKTCSRVSELECMIDRNKWHRAKLEQVHRLLENNEIACQEVDDLGDMLEYYLDMNQDPDYMHDETIYSHLPFDKLDSKVGEELSIGRAAKAIPGLSPKSAAAVLATSPTSGTSQKELQATIADAFSLKMTDAMDSPMPMQIPDSAYSPTAAGSSEDMSVSITRKRNKSLSPRNLAHSPQSVLATRRRASLLAAAFGRESPPESSRLVPQNPAIEQVRERDTKDGTVELLRRDASVHASSMSRQGERLAPVGTRASSMLFSRSISAIGTVPTSRKISQLDSQGDRVKNGTSQASSRHASASPSKSNEPPQMQEQVLRDIGVNVLDSQQTISEGGCRGQAYTATFQTVAIDPQSDNPSQTSGKEVRISHPSPLSEEKGEDMEAGQKLREDLELGFTPKCDHPTRFLTQHQRDQQPTPAAPQEHSQPSFPPGWRDHIDTSASSSLATHELLPDPAKCTKGPHDEADALLMSGLRHISPTQENGMPNQVDASWPQAPVAAQNAHALFEKLDTDALFFAFYFQQGTYLQYLASRELKKQAWRYHTRYNTWFQRHSSPHTLSSQILDARLQTATEESEQGSYVYFDFNLHQVEGANRQTSGWCTRIKNSFTFEYKYLEDGSRQA
eukprot:SM000008S22377  [mRNA]  locus=s8:1302711:1309258:+ [translate_table: standard]